MPPSHFGSQRLAFSLSQMQFSSVAQSRLILCYPMGCSTPGLPVRHQLLKLTQTHGREWRREWQTTLVFLPLDPHEEHDQALSLHACKRRFEGRRAELGEGVGSRSPLPFTPAACPISRASLGRFIFYSWLPALEILQNIFMFSFLVA